MTRLLLRSIGLALLLPAAHASAEWKVLSPAAGAAPEVAYDPARTQHEPPYWTTWTRVVLLAPGKLSDGSMYLSALEKVAVDCHERKWAITYSEFYPNRDATGMSVSSYSLPQQEWKLKAVRLNSSGDKLVRALCATPKS